MKVRALLSVLTATSPLCPARREGGEPGWPHGILPHTDAEHPNSETLGMKMQTLASFFSIPTFPGPTHISALLRPPCQQHTRELQHMPIHARPTYS